MDFFYCGTLAESFVHDEMTFAGRGDQKSEKLFFCFASQVPGIPQAIAACFQTADRFLEGFLIIFADAHHFAYRAHLGAQLILNTLEFFEGPAGKFDNHIISVGHIFIQGSVLAAGDILQGKAACQHGGNQCDGEPGSLGGQCGGTGGSGVDFNNNNTIGFRVVGELYIGAADDLNAFHDPVGLLLQTLLAVLGYGEHGSGAERITGMYAEGIDVFNEADGDHVVFTVSYNFQLQFFPAENGFFHENLTYHTGLKASCTDGFELVHIVNKSAACAAHGIGGTENDRITQAVGDCKRFFHTVGNFTAGHFNAKLVHGFFEFNTIFAAFDGIYLDADYFNVVFFQNAGFIQL